MVSKGAVSPHDRGASERGAKLLAEPGAETLDGVMAGLGVDAETLPTGLSASEAASRLRRFGRNQLKAGTAVLPLAILVNQFRSPLVLILLAAAGLSYFLGEVAEALIIAAIVVASSGLGFFQEYRASHTIAALRQRLAVTTRVARDGKIGDVAADEIVPGDVLVLAAGSLIAADGVVIEATELHADEAALTGESFPAPKAALVGGAVAGAANRVHMGTSVRSGTARVLVVKTGTGTQYGSIASAVAHSEPETSFARGVRNFGLLMTQVMMVLVTTVFAVNLLLHRPLLESLLFAAALAVGITPELLPAIVTVTLSRGAQKLARSGVLVKRLVAIENLGAMDVLCTDKTGTLTEGNVQLERATGVDGEISADTLCWAALNARLQSGLPNPLDSAIVEAAPSKIAGYGKLGEVPYDFERKRLSVLVAGPDGNVLITKGAVGAVLPACTHMIEAGKRSALTAPRRAREEKRLAAWSAEGLRVLAIAIKPLGAQATCRLDDEAGLVLCGYLLFSDPLKAGIVETVAALHANGVALKIITGDNRYVAAHMAAKVGLSPKHLMLGSDVARLGVQALARRVAQAELFAEVSPDQKERIVAAVRRSGKVVGYLGDGINDAPALRAADLGISVEGAVDAAKEAADIVLLKRDLKVLLDGIVIGRGAFGNTRKYIAITTSANLGNMISMAVASLALPFLPLLAMQILLNNFLSDIPLIAVSTDRVDEEILKAPGRWEFGTLLRSMLAFGLVSSAFDGLTFLVLLGVFHADAATFQTAWFTESLMTELAIVWVMRTRRPFLTNWPSPVLAWLSLAVGAVALALPYLPLAATLGFRPLPIGLMLTMLGILISYVAASEVLKLFIFAPRAAKLRHRTKSTV